MNLVDPIQELDSFFSRSIIDDLDNDGCWVWAGAHSAKGYGFVNMGA